MAKNWGVASRTWTDLTTKGGKPLTSGLIPENFFA
jgi:hypothetical protein